MGNHYDQEEEDFKERRRKEQQQKDQEELEKERTLSDVVWVSWKETDPAIGVAGPCFMMLENHWSSTRYYDLQGVVVGRLAKRAPYLTEPLTRKEALSRVRTIRKFQNGNKLVVLYRDVGELVSIGALFFAVGEKLPFYIRDMPQWAKPSGIVQWERLHPNKMPFTQAKGVYLRLRPLEAEDGRTLMERQWVEVADQLLGVDVPPIGPMPEQYAAKLLFQLLASSPNTDFIIQYQEVDEGLVLLSVIRPLSLPTLRTSDDVPDWFRQR